MHGNQLWLFCAMVTIEIFVNVFETCVNGLWSVLGLNYVWLKSFSSNLRLWDCS